MKVFISWSGQRSRLIAESLRTWLPDVLQNVQPWMSATDIDAGARWNRHVSDELKKTQVGILCITQENQQAPWVLFEAGALAKTVEVALVCPYLIHLSPADLVPGPLTQFQAKTANIEGTWDLVQTLNRALDDQALPEERLRRIFDRFWPDLEKAITDLPVLNEGSARRPIEDMVEEMLTLVRSLANRPSMLDDVTKAGLIRSYVPLALASYGSTGSVGLGEALKIAADQRFYLDMFVKSQGMSTEADEGNSSDDDAITEI